MDINSAQIAATTVTAFLLPFVKLGANKMAEKMGEKVGEGTAGKVANLSKSLWQKVKGIFSSERDKVTIEDFEEMPDETAELLIKKLQKKLDENPDLAKELHQMIEQPLDDKTSMSGAQIMNAHIASIMDFRHANFSGSKGVTITGISIGDQAGLDETAEE